MTHAVRAEPPTASASRHPVKGRMIIGVQYGISPTAIRCKTTRHLFNEREDNRQTRRGRRRKEGGIERRTKEGTGKTYKQIAKGKRTFVAETLSKKVLEAGLTRASIL